MKLITFTFLPAIILLIACGKSAEITVVQTNPNSLLSSVDTTRIVNDASFDDEFQTITLVESSKIYTSDPLFAETNSELRYINLLYDGLTAIDESGSIKPALAQRWLVTRDSLRYTFFLRNNAFFHNSNKFASGTGRKVIASDVEFVFERMGTLSVPDLAAQFFSSVEGFDAFRNEQNLIKNPEKRSINSIEGIEVRNDSTIIFQLTEKDEEFLQKLAHPWSSVYAKESIDRRNPTITNSIGTGPYYSVRKQRNELILASFDEYYSSNEIPDRLDIIVPEPDSDLIKKFADQEVHHLIEPDPNTLINIADSTGNLKNEYASAFILEEQNSQNIVTLFFNPLSGAESAEAFMKSKSGILPKPVFGKIDQVQNAELVNVQDQSFTISYTEEPAKIYLIDLMANHLSQYGATITLSSSFAISDDVTFTVSQLRNGIELLNWKAPVFILSKRNVEFSPRITSHPWNISFTK